MSTFSSIQKLMPREKHLLIIIILFFFAILRGIADYVWLPYYQNWKMFTLITFNGIVYIYVLYFGIVGLSVLFLKVIGKQIVSDEAIEKVYWYSTFIWLVYPLVALLSWLLDGPQMITVPIFKYIPFFLVENNFLPIGMLIVIPIILSSYTFLFNKYFNTSIINSIFISILSTSIIYTLYYQYLLNISFLLLYKTNYWIFIGFYSFLFIPFTLLFISSFKKALNTKSNLLYYMHFIFGIICLALVVYGWYHLDTDRRILLTNIHLIESLFTSAQSILQSIT